MTRITRAGRRKLVAAGTFALILMGSTLPGAENGDVAAAGSAPDCEPGRLTCVTNPPSGPSDVNLLSPDLTRLGKLLFFDSRLSGDGSVSCSSCHNPQFAFTDGARVSEGIRGQEGRRSAPTIINSVFSQLQFWDGRAASLEEQAKAPFVNPKEMDTTHEAVVERLRGIAGYRELFAKAFATENMTIEHVAEAIAAFERTVISSNSPFDRFRAGDQAALTKRQQRGMTLFFGKARCHICHTEPFFTDGKFHNLGIGVDAALPDEGRFEHTKDVNDRGAFKTPTLREVVSTGPYMHDGSVRSLDAVVGFYNGGGNANPNLDPEIRPLGLSNGEREDLVAFLRSLSGDGWRCIRRPVSTEFPK